MRKKAGLFRIALVATVGFSFAVCDISGLSKLPAIAVTGVRISPEAAKIERGESREFAAAIATSGGAPAGVTWTLEGATHWGTGISGDGTLVVSFGEEAETLTVRATSAFDSSVYETAIVAVVPSPPEGSLAWQLARLRNYAMDGGLYVIEISADEEIASGRAVLPAGRSEVVLKLRGVGDERNVRLSGAGNLVRVGPGVTLILDGGIALRGAAGNDSPLVLVEPGGTLIMNEGARIAGNTGVSARGAGVSVRGSFTMNGGRIHGNVADREGGGVFVWPSGVFAMNGGEIHGNVADREGGGVFVAGTFAMYGGVIRDNTAASHTWARGGGVIVGCHDNGLFVMRGGVISGNAAVSDTEAGAGAGGVHVGGYRPGGGTFLITDGAILDDNVARFAGNMADISSPLNAEGTATAWHGTFAGGTFTPMGDLSYAGHAIEIADGVLQGVITLTITGIPVRYDNWSRSVSLWDGQCGWSGSTTEWVTGSSATFTVFARPGNFRIYFYLWQDDEWVEYAMRSRSRLAAGVNTIPFSRLARN